MIGASMVRLGMEWLEARRLLARLCRSESGQPVVSYAHIGFPHGVFGPKSIAHGGSVKYRVLNPSFPHAGLAANVLYVVSSGRYAWLTPLLRRAQRLGIKIVWNQNGAFFPSAYGSEMARRENQRMYRQLCLADYVFYQSDFAKVGSDLLLGVYDGPNEVLHNAVDTTHFVPREAGAREGITLLACGSHNDVYRLPLAFDVFMGLLDRGQPVRFTVAGRLTERMESTLRARAEQAGVVDRVTFLGPYTQADAPAVYQSADVLLHTQYNDVCPSVVVEAMACGLPVIYSRTGGTPELVGEDAGCGVTTPLDWDTPRPPAAEALIDAGLELLPNLPEAAQAARSRAVNAFDVSHWVARHEAVFKMLTGSDAVC